MTKDLVPLSFLNTDEYEGLITDCCAIIVENIKISKMHKILAYGQLGERIVKDPLYKKYGKGSSAFLEAIADDVKISRSEIYRAIQFYEKFKIVSPDSENWSKFEEGENISWGRIKLRYLTALVHEDCKHTFEKIDCWKCRKCKKIIDYNPNEKPRAIK